MRDIRVLVPSIGHPTRPSLVDALHDNGERTVEVVGADMDADGLGRHVPDVFYPVPARTDPRYLDRILEICREARVDVYYALGEEEAIASSERRAEFERQGVRVMTPGTAEMLRIATNKARYHEFFAARGLPHAAFRVIDRFEAVEPALRAMGYPDVDVFLKPAFSKGGRGARLVTARKQVGATFNAKAGDAPEQSLEAVLEALDRERAKGFQQLLAMEYLPGTYYSVDVLSRDGEVLYAIPKIRVAGSASNTTVGEVDLNPDVMALAREVCAAFGFSFLQNYEMKLDREGRPRVYDINPRGGTSLILCAAAGANIAYWGVKMALGEEVPVRPVRNRVRMLRYYKEYFRYAD
jgi:carbamoyl-phosphate synthase large subunit